MQRKEMFILTIHHWPHAIAANVPPVVDTQFESGPSFYRPEVIEFDHRPTRDDMLEVIRQVPYMAHHYQPYMKLLETTEFPMVPMQGKAGQCDIIEDGKIVGRIEVRRTHVYLNRYRHIPYVMTEPEQIARYIPKERREEAIKYATDRENLIKERYVRNYETDNGYTVLDAVREVLFEGGFVKSKRSRKKLAV